MKDIPRENWSPLNGETTENRILTISFVGSVLIHAILLGLMFVGFDHTPRISMAPSAINVTMISTGDLPEPPPPAMKTKTANLAPKSSEEAEAPMITEEDLSEGEPEGQEEEAPAEAEPESAVPEPPAEEPETAAPEPTPREPEVKKAALKKPAELPEPIPPVAKEQVVIKEKVVIKDAPKVEEKPEPKPEKAEEKPKTAQAASPDAEAKPQAKEAEPKVIKSGAKNRKAANDQKSVITPSAARADSIKDAINKVKAKAKQGSGGQSGGTAVAANRTGSATGETGQTGEAGQSGGVVGATGKIGGVIGGAGKAGGMAGSISDIYKAQISYQIERNWAFSDNLAGGRKDLRTILVITILPTGQIENLWYEQRSGNNFLDQSAYNAVMKSNPLPPLPRGLSEYTIALVFTPTGLN